MSEKQFTVIEMIDAIRANGLPQINGNYFQFEDGHKGDKALIDSKIVATCAMGQAFVNLGVKESDYWHYETGIGIDDLINTIPEWNDIQRYDYNQIADEAKQYAEELGILDDVITSDIFDYVK